MQYHVIQSSDPYLLARLCTDLQMEGVNRYIGVDLDPFDDNHFIHIEKVDFCVRSHGFCNATLPKNHHTLTARNYIQVLTKILEQ